MNLTKMFTESITHNATQDYSAASEFELAEKIAAVEVHCARALSESIIAMSEIEREYEESIGDKVKGAYEGAKKFLIKVVNFIKTAVLKGIAAIKGLFGSKTYKGLSKLQSDAKEVLKKAKAPTTNLDKNVDVVEYDKDKVFASPNMISDSSSGTLATVNTVFKAIAGDNAINDVAAVITLGANDAVVKLKSEEMSTITGDLDDAYEELEGEITDASKDSMDKSKAYNTLVTRLKDVANGVGIFGKGEKSPFKKSNEDIKKFEKLAKALDKIEREANKMTSDDLAEKVTIGDTKTAEVAIKNLGNVQIALSRTISILSANNRKQLQYAGKVANLVNADMNIVRAQFTK